MKTYILQLVGTATGEPHKATGQYLREYNPEYHLAPGQYDGGALDLTAEASQAKRFSSLAEVLEVYHASPTCTCHARRADGEPNRPLTAFTISVESVQ